MKPSARSREILSALREYDELTVEKACELFQISPATVRRDFAALAESGKVEKTWGGIRANGSPSGSMLPSGFRETLQAEEKKRIAARAATLCRDGDIVFIDGGTTTLQLARWFADRPLRIVTNSLLIAHEIDRLRTATTGAEVFLTGGYLYPRSGLLVGPEAINGLQKYQATIAFLSVGGITPEGISNNHHLVVEVERVMLERADQVALLADASKFDRKELVQECRWSEIDFLVTDKAPAEHYHRQFGSQIIVT